MKTIAVAAALSFIALGVTAGAACTFRIHDECQAEECGTRPGVPTYLCDDGTVGGFTGRCLSAGDGGCGWEIRNCPGPHRCGAFAFGACGSGEACIHAVGVCDTPGDQGTCQTIPTTCTKEYAPVCGCDERTYGNECMAKAAGQSVLHFGECAPTTCAIGDACGPGRYCVVADGTCASASPAKARGVCIERPTACDTMYAPVCGCDGVTYSNACAASLAGVNVATHGPCGASETCGGLAGLGCASGEYCRFEDATCHNPDMAGTCARPPQTCPSDVAPVCGCDGKTYSNSCAAAAASTSVLHDGPC